MRHLAIIVFDDEITDGRWLAMGLASIPEGSTWQHAFGEATGRFLRQDFRQIEGRANVIDLDAERAKRRSTPATTSA